MASDYVTSWLEERKPRAKVTYLGPNEDGIHLWDLAFPDGAHTFRIGVPEEVVEDDALLAERLMELDTQGWVDQAGERDLWVLVGPAELAEGAGRLRGRLRAG
jgi:hypothetical protein